jgi:transposase
MGKSKYLSQAVKQVIVDSYRQTENYSETARILNMDQETVYAVVKRYEMRGNVDAKKYGRPRKMDTQDERQLIRLMKSHRTTPLKDITIMGQFNHGRQVPVSERSVHRYL